MVGEIHIHLKPEALLLHMLAEDLHVAPAITMWNDNLVDQQRILTKQTRRDAGTTRVYDLATFEQEPSDI